MKKIISILMAVAFMTTVYAVVNSQVNKDAKKNTIVAKQAKIGDKITCPVMKTEFTVTKASPKYEYMGKTYFFCCPGCIEKFKNNPEKYAQTKRFHKKIRKMKEHKKCREKGKKDCKGCDTKGKKNCKDYKTKEKKNCKDCSAKSKKDRKSCCKELNKNHKKRDMKNKKKHKGCKTKGKKNCKDFAKKKKKGCKDCKDCNTKK